ncbi:MAG: ABC transporter ATP-binding protein [Oscillospiraceae bacterium]|nr:ABC transporter ATP-binding protein [Oscillospiraceae bacterium]
MLKLLKYLTKHAWALAVLAVGFVVTQVWLDLTLPDYMADITRLVQTPGSKMSEIITAGLKMLGCAAGSLAASVVTALCASKIAADFSANLRGEMFRKVQSFSMQEIGRFSTASLITRSTNDITQVQMVIVLGLQVMIKAPIMAVWAIMKISGKQWQWLATTGAAVVILLTVVIVCLVLAYPKFRKLQALTDDLNRVTRENLTGIRVVRAYNAEQYQEEKFEQANAELTGTHLFAMHTMAFMMPGIQLIMSGISLAVYWLGAALINNAADMTEKADIFSEMMVFSQYAIQVVMAFMMLVMIFMVLPRASVAAQRIGEVLGTKASITDGTVTACAPDCRGEITFDRVSFRYPDGDGDVLHDISFTAKRGETVALIGATGCGKSTVVNLIPRFYDVTEGTVTVGGVNVKDYTQNALREMIGYVSQKATLFSGTVRSNVAYGSAHSEDEEVNAAMEIAQGRDILEKTEQGADAYVAQGGSNFSGGQKQRISIARAVFRHPDILIFDDSFSALDYKTDRALRSELKKHCADSTKIIVAQRIGTIKDADRIIVLEEGSVAGMGTHAELMQSCEVYRQIAYSQLSEKELA